MSASTLPSASLRTDDSTERAQRTTQKLGRQLDNLDEQMADAKKFLRQLNKNMGVKSPFMYRFANFMFLAVIFGIEFDMTGLSCSAMTYWEYDIFLLRFFLFFNMFSFVAPLVIHYWMSSSNAPSGGQHDGQPPRTALPGVKSRGGGSDAFVTWLRGTVQTSNPFGGEVKFYHFLPGIRFYLFIKSDTDMTDVDSIFRINTLSSFTFGIYQLMGIMFTVVEGKELNLFVWMNVASQVVNWSITFLYFVTPISAWMGRASEAKTKSRFYQGLMNYWAARYCEHDALLFEVGGDDVEIGKVQKEKQRVKERLAERITSAFAGKTNKDGKDIDQFSLQKMRDLDVRDFLEIMRDQAIASLEMRNSQ